MLRACTTSNILLSRSHHAMLWKAVLQGTLQARHISIDEYNEAIINECTQLQNAAQIVENAKCEVSALFDTLQNRITSKLSALRGNYDIILFNQQVAKAKENLNFQIGMESKIQELIKAVNQFCTDIDSVLSQLKIAPIMLSPNKEYQTEIEEEALQRCSRRWFS